MGTRGLVLVDVKMKVLLVLHSPIPQLSLPQGKWVVRYHDSPQLELGDNDVAFQRIYPVEVYKS
jgi:hypothetical protein